MKQELKFFCVHVENCNFLFFYSSAPVMQLQGSATRHMFLEAKTRQKNISMGIGSLRVTSVATSMGFEPTRGDPNGLAVHRLNRSATMSSTFLCLNPSAHLVNFLVYRVNTFFYFWLFAKMASAIWCVGRIHLWRSRCFQHKWNMYTMWVKLEQTTQKNTEQEERGLLLILPVLVQTSHQGPRRCLHKVSLQSWQQMPSHRQGEKHPCSKGLILLAYAWNGVWIGLACCQNHPNWFYWISSLKKIACTSV